MTGLVPTGSARASLVALSCLALLAVARPAAGLDYEPPGALVAGSGTGRVDDTVYAPAMRFPLEAIPAYANSQVHGHGGNLGPGGGQCDPENYAFPWYDNFCETRSWETPLCPTGNGHQGQDIRPSTCADDTWWAVAAEDGEITGVGSYSVILTSDSGTQYRYLHLSMDQLAVGLGDRVARGDRIGLVSNDFGDTATTIHLHFEVLQYVASVGGVTHVPPYMSLVRSYEALEGGADDPCAALGPDGGIIDDSNRDCVSLNGPPAYWRAVAGYGVGGGLSWTHAFDGERPSNWARWRVVLEAAGPYRVAVSVGADWIDANGFDQTRGATYRVRHGGIESDVLVDQSTGTDGWIDLGVLDFAAGADQWVAVFDDTGEDGALERKIVVDALRLTPVDLSDPCAVLDSQWTAVSECVLAGTGPCAEQGERTETRQRCSDGAVVDETRQVPCVVPTDGDVVADWSVWGACVDTGSQRRDRTVCADGAPSRETEWRACTPPTRPTDPVGTRRASARSGCSVGSARTRGPPSGAVLGGMMLAMLTRRRR